MVNLQLDTYTPHELGEAIQRSTTTLASWRSRGKGPRFVRVMGRIYYPKDAVQEWLEAEMSAA